MGDSSIWFALKMRSSVTMTKCSLMHLQSLAAEERMLLLKMLSGLTERNLTEENLTSYDLEGLLNGTLKDTSVPPPQERSPCKNFFWKTFSSC